jgi:hypothetical protein
VTSDGRSYTPTHAAKKGRPYFYYILTGTGRGASVNTIKRLPADEFPSLPKTVQAALILKNAISPRIFPPEERTVSEGVVDPKAAENLPMTICVGKKP